jgi:hypothetical protein
MRERGNRCAGPRSLSASLTMPRGLSVASCLVATVLVALLALPSAALASEPCPNEALRAESNVNPASGKPYSTELPDCRAYELVSSGQEDNKAMGPAGGGGYALASVDGHSLVWGTEGTWPYGQRSNGNWDVLKATRGTHGWSSPLTLAPEGVDGRESLKLVAASADLSTVLISGNVIEREGTFNLLESGPGGCCATVAGNIPGRGGVVAQLSADGSHVFLQTYPPLLSEDTHGPINISTGEPATRQVYEWTQAGGLRLAGVDSEGKATSPCGAAFAVSGELESGPEISADGSRVFFQSPDPLLGHGSGSPPGECELGPVVEGKKLYVSDLYVRENGSTTIDISKPPLGVPDYGAQFVSATPDGSKVFFVSESALTPDKAHSGPGYADLYEYDVETRVLTRISVGQEEASLTSISGLERSTIVSADGSHMYFTALGRLVPGAGRTRAQNENNCKVSQTSCTENLYLYANGRISFIANIVPGRSKGGTPRAPLFLSVAAVTPDGSDVVFESTSSLTAYDSEGHGELYRYDAASATISCVSCSPTGARAEGPEGEVYLHASPPTIESAETAATSNEQLGGLSSDGSTVFFAASRQLLPAAVNAAGVYEWRDGVLSLISTGKGLSTLSLLGASPSGSDVFFTTESQLVPQDGDNAQHIYDARVQGGFPAPSTPAPCASVATCRSMVATPPVPVAPASISVSGPGNVTSVTESQSPPATVKPKPLMRVQKLSKALKACKKDKSKSKRTKCEKEARKKYGTKSKSAQGSLAHQRVAATAARLGRNGRDNSAAHGS